MFWRANFIDPADKDSAMRDVALAKTIGETIDATYPGHFFRTTVDSKGGVVQIRHPLLPPQMHYVIKLKDLNGDPGMRLVKRAAGELLERFFQPRDRRREDLWSEARQKHRRTMHGFLTERNFKTGDVRYRLPSEVQP